MLIENMQMAFFAIRINKMRSILTMLGIIIGIGSVISIVSIGDTMRAMFADLYKNVGLTQAYVSIGYWVNDTRQGDYFNLDEMEQVKEAFPEMDSLPQEVRDVTSRLSADYLIHDLQTGHFVTVLRFISPLMVRLGVPERRFYQLLAAVLSDYMKKHPQMSERFALFSLFRPQIIRVVLNPVKLTWPDLDGGSRMLPNYLEDLQNPLWLVTQEYES